MRCACVLPQTMAGTGLLLACSRQSQSIRRNNLPSYVTSLSPLILPFNCLAISGIRSSRVMRRSIVSLSIVATRMACRARAPGGPASSADSGLFPDGGAVGAPSTPVLTFSLVDNSTADAGTVVPLSIDQPTIDPVQTLTLQVNGLLRNFRVRIFDEADRVLESDDRVLDSQSGTS